MILGIDHVGIAVADMDAAIVRYGELLQEIPALREVSEHDGIEATLFDLAGGGMELISSVRTGSAIEKFLDKHGEGLHHVAYRVDDINDELAQCVRRGLVPIDKVPRRGIRGYLVAFIHPASMGGVLTELCQHVDGLEDITV